MVDWSTKVRAFLHGLSSNFFTSTDFTKHLNTLLNKWNYLSLEENNLNKFSVYPGKKIMSMWQ